MAEYRLIIVHSYLTKLAGGGKAKADNETLVALENFLLPGNKEDGPDKSRHWNVFGGVAIYKSPKESLILALKRENVDLKDQNFSPEAMQEFIRDTIANINGIYYVVSINPNLIPDIEGL